MTQAVEAHLAISDIGDQLQTNPFYDQRGGTEPPFRGRWMAQTGIVRGDLIVNQGELYTPTSSPTRRHLLAVAAVNAGGFQVLLSFHGQGGFLWNGGLPLEAIDADDYNYIASPDTAARITVGNLFVTTSPITEPQVYLAIPSTGSTGTFLFVEGEEEDTFRVWNP